MRKRSKAILMAIVTLAVSCSSYFIAEYDPAVEGGATDLQAKVDRFLIDLQQTTGTPGGDYEHHIGFYDEVRSDIETLRDAASVQRGNALTVQSLDLIEKNVDKLETMHAEGISPEEIGVVRTLFDTQFRMLVKLENAKKRKEN